MKILSNFEGGSIKVIDTHDIHNIQLELAPDSNKDIKQWFYFQCITKAKHRHTLVINNAGDSTFAHAWHNYHAMASYDQSHWFRVKTLYENGKLIISHTPKKSKISYAYFTPYTLQRHKKFLARIKKHPQCSIEYLTTTAKNNHIELIQIGELNTTKKVIWLIARQHPGETMSQWLAEGLINSLLLNDQITEQILANAVFFIIPNMNLDGSVLGNHRTNFHGLDLNRQWHSPCKYSCPEVYFTQHKMQQTGVDLFFDVHGDEEIPYTFAMPTTRSCKTSLQAKKFTSTLTKHSHDFQTRIDYNTYQNKQCLVDCCDKNTPLQTCCNVAKEKSNSVKAVDHVADHFGALAILIEMPFKDHNDSPNALTGWSAERSSQLGSKLRIPILDFLN